MKWIKLGGFGAVLGLGIGFSFALLFSVIYQSPTWLPAPPSYVSRFTTPLLATVVSAGL